VLVIMVAALLLAALVNADDLVARAERQPLGPDRDRSLAIWHPVQDVSHVLQLYRVRQLADWVAGNDRDQGGGGDPSAAAPAGTDVTADNDDAPRSGAPEGGEPAADEQVELRTPTPSKPLRVWVGGDSMAQTFGESLVRLAGATGVMDATLHYEISSGLTRQDYYDWPRGLAADVEKLEPEVVIAVFGANDAQGIVLQDGTPVQEMSDSRWAPEYSRRVAAVMDQLRADGRLVVWLTQPPMRDAGFDSRIDLINQIYAAEAASRPWVLLVDSSTVLGDDAGAFAEMLPNGSGGVDDMRQDDGVHLTRAGGDRLAALVVAAISARAGLENGADPAT
jgi:hypothetical protein